MQDKSNREFKELIEKVYQQKFGKKNYMTKVIEETKIIPSFFYNDLTNEIKIELKEDETSKDFSDLNKFYNDLQNIEEYKTKDMIIKISCDEYIKNKVLDKYTDIIHFKNKPNSKYYTKKYFKGKIIVEFQAMEDIIEYSIEHKLSLRLNGKEVQFSKEELKLKFDLKDIEGNYYFELNQNINKFKYIIYTNHNIYIYYNKEIYKFGKDFIKKMYPILMVFLKNYKNSIYISKNNLTNFFSLIYPSIKDSIIINSDIYEKVKKYIPQALVTKLFLDFDIKNYLIAELKFCYLDIEFNPIEQNKINANRNLLKETLFLNKLVETGFLLDEKNKRFVISNDDDIYNFINKELEEYAEISEVYTTERLDKRRIRKSEKTGIGVKVDNNLLEISFNNLPIDKEEIKEVLKKYRLKKKYHRLKDGSFISLEDNQDVEFLDSLFNGLDIYYKDIEETIQLPISRTLYLEKLLNNNPQVIVNSNSGYKEIIKNVNKVDEDGNIPSELVNILRDYQRIGYNWLTVLDKYGFGGILADDMGLGKTIQLLSVILANKDKEDKIQASLVVAPSSLTLNWKNEAEKFAGRLTVLVIDGNAEERSNKIKKIKDYDLIITSYDLLKRDIDKYEDLDYVFKYIIADEAQYIKNNNTQNSKAIKRVRAKTRFALTGTPMENSLSELWSIFDFVMPGYLFTYKKFKKNYEVPIVKEQDDKILKKLKMIIEPFVLRRTKKEVLKELPDKTTTVLNNEMLEEQEKIYLSYLSQARDELNEEIEDKGFEQSRIKILALLTRLRQICCHPSLFISNYRDGSGKLNQCVELVKDGIQSGHKILLFSGYTSMFEIIEKALNRENINYLKLTGKTNVRERFSLIEKFNNEDDIKVFLISLKAGGTGINLTSADMVIHYDPWWNLSVENQATDRTHRIGQKKKVQVYKLITKNSIEEKIYELQQRKKELIDNMLSTDTKFINKLSKEDIMRLFE